MSYWLKSQPLSTYPDASGCHLEAFRHPVSLEARDESCSEEGPQAQASTSAQLNNPGGFKGASLCASKAFYQWEPSWLPTIRCLHEDLFFLHLLCFKLI